MKTSATFVDMISVLNRQRRLRLQIRWLREAAAPALRTCRTVSGDGRFALNELTEITVAVVSDAAISKIHEEFMGIAGATDVITFEHGDIVVSADTAHACAARFTHTTE